MSGAGDIVALFYAAVERGVTVREFAEETGLSPSTIRRLEDRGGVRLKRVRVYPKKHSPKTHIDWASALTDAAERGLSVNRLAAELNVTNGAVISAEDRTGIYLPRRRLNPKRVGGFKQNAAD